jgi:RNA-directed DNA polymerase
MTKPNVEKWLERRGYVHFDRHIAAEKIERRVRDPEYVASHGFMPFIGYSIEEPKYKRLQRKVLIKSRPIRFASHLDSHVFAYYANLLAEPYEEALRANSLSENVLAYRKHEIEGERRGKCNIHFANEAFEWVKQYRDCTAFAFDVEGFFDSIDHGLLKQQWQNLIGDDRLAEDHYKVFRAITKYCWVELAAMADALGFGRNRLEKSRVPFSTPKAFRERIAKQGLLQINKGPFGIPQGSPISALLSNIAMLDFDCMMAQLVKNWNGLYRRYSDDILVIVPSEYANDVGVQTWDTLAKTTNGTLKLNDEKTVVSAFETKGGKLIADTPLSYLGFDFDGQQKLIRQKTISRFQRRMVQAVRSAARAANKASGDGKDGRVWRRELYERYSHLGKRNFVTYAYRCASIMNAPEIKRQTRRHWERLNRLINED